MKISIATIFSRIFFIAGLLGATYLIGGFFKFADIVINSPKPDDTIYADAIVSLTGGSKQRLTEGVKLLELEHGNRLLISGVYKNATQEEIRIVTGGSKELFDCCVDLGREATDTIGNAQEVREWVEKYKFKSIILITDNYHMPRSVLEIKNENPDLIIKQYSIKAGSYIAKKWWEDEIEFKGLLNEYSKYVAAQLRLMLKFNPKNDINKTNGEK